MKENIDASSFKSDFKAFAVDQTVIAPSIGSSEYFPSQYLYKEAYNNFNSRASIAQSTRYVARASNVH